MHDLCCDSPRSSPQSSTKRRLSQPNTKCNITLQWKKLRRRRVNRNSSPKPNFVPLDSPQCQECYDYTRIVVHESDKTNRLAQSFLAQSIITSGYSGIQLITGNTEFLVAKKVFGAKPRNPYLVGWLAYCGACKGGLRVPPGVRADCHSSA